jgi:mRNA interferase MazF
MNPKPGEVWLVDLGLAAKTRPIVIVSRYDPNPPRALVLYIPVTTQKRGSEYEVELPVLPFLRQGSIANVQGLGSVPSVRLERKLGELSGETMLIIKQALMFALDLGNIGQQDKISDTEHK